MSDKTGLLDEPAKAAQEIAKATGQVVDAGREVGSFIARFIAGPLEQGMGIFEDKLRYMRWERQLRLMTQANEKMRSLGLNGPDRGIPMKLAVPLFQAAAMEEDNYLQDRWVNLLVNGANSHSGIDIQRSFIEILEQITSLEAQILDVIYQLPDDSGHMGVITDSLPNAAHIGVDESATSEAPSSKIQLALGNLARLGCLRIRSSWGGGEIFQRVNMTVLGREFVTACRLNERI
jgi:Abortive infection alpha